MSDLKDKQDIYEVLCKYCRGLDRMDKALSYSTWHSDGTALYHNMYEGTGHGFVDWAWEVHASMERHSHQIANHIIVVDGDSAKSEAYATVALWTLPDKDNKQQEIICKGRYLDSWSKREGKWAIDHRVHVLDLQTINVLNRGDVNDVSSRDSSDASFEFLK